MFTILAIISVLLIVIPLILYVIISDKKISECLDYTLGTLVIIGIFVTFGFGTAALYHGYQYAKINTTIDEKIKIYTEQNKEIESKVAVVVDNYLNHEKDTYTNLKNESKITLATMYPDLKSNTLVQEQIKLYNENNKKLTKCKLQKTKATFYRKLCVPFS